MTNLLIKLKHLQPRRAIGSSLRVALITGLLTALLAVPAMSQSNLPSMGEPADNALSPLEEVAIGRQFMRQIRTSLPLARDTQLQEYITNLGQQLVQASGRQTSNFTFFIVQDPSVNAFAIPGGYIGVNLGLINAMIYEDNLAGVLAHEIAHVTQRHHARTFALGKSRKLSAAATILAAILIGAASPEAGQAALAAGIAATQQSSINFTRSNESEADRIGIAILDSAEFDPAAMAQSFSILERKNRLNTSGLELEYLRTHPLDSKRIAEAADRAANMTKRGRGNQLDFTLFKARLRVLTTADPALQLQREASQWRREPTADTAYALAMLNLRANHLDKAGQWMDELLKITKDNPKVLLLSAELTAAEGNTAQSKRQLKALHSLFPERYSILEVLLDQVIDDRQLGRARALAKDYIRHSDDPNPKAYRTLASVQQQLGETAASHESLAYYFAEQDEFQRAASQLELALRHIAPGSQDELRLKASLKVVKGTGPR